MGAVYQAFETVLRPFSIPTPELERVFADLVARYGENGRFYHNLQHIEQTLAVAAQLNSWVHDGLAVQLALWFHDVVYDPRAQDNEEQSAVYAVRVLTGLGLPDGLISAVSYLILLTKHHQTAETDVNGQVVLDADLSILAASPAEYGRYAQAIRQEYSFVPEEHYRQGRTAVLQQFLARPHLFYTPPMQSLTQRARDNLQTELEQLRDEGRRGRSEKPETFNLQPSTLNSKLETQNSKLMKRLLFLLLLFLPACAVVPVVVPTRLPMAVVSVHATVQVETAVSPIPATFTPIPFYLVTPSPYPTATLRPTITPSPIATSNPYEVFTIASLTARTYGGGQVEIVEDIAENDQYKQYLIRYPSDGLMVYGFMNVPNEGVKFPVAIVLHGYIDPDEYEVLDYTARYAESLVKAGYFVIHPNFRNYPPSDSGSNEFRIGYAVDILNLIAIIREQAQDPLGILRRADVENIHLWGHSMGGGVVLRVITVNQEPYIKAAVLYGSMSGDEEQNFTRIQAWRGGLEPFELQAPTDMLRAISPIYHLERITTAVSVHHSPDDATVPVEWSYDLCEVLQQRQKSVECFFYDGQPHTFHGHADLLFMERVVTFFRTH